LKKQQNNKSVALSICFEPRDITN